MAARVTGHVWKRKGARTTTWYAKYRDASGVQRQEKIGPAWAEKGRPPSGYYTERTAIEWLQGKLTDLRREAPTSLANDGTRTFGDAIAEWLRYVEDEKQRAPST